MKLIPIFFFNDIYNVGIISILPRFVSPTYKLRAYGCISSGLMAISSGLMVV